MATLESTYLTTVPEAAEAAGTIALFLPSFAGGGAERVMLTLAEAFSDRGFSTDLVVARGHGPLRDQVPPRVRTFDLGSSRVVASLPGLVRYLRRERPAGLLSTLGHANVVALWARALARVPVRIIVRETSTLTPALANARLMRTRLMPHVARIFYPNADGIVAVSEGAADDFSRVIKIPREKIRVIYNPVLSADLFRKAQEPITHPWFSPSGDPVVLSVGRLTRAKDYPNLLRAFALLRQKRRVRLVILGEGEERGALERTIHDMGLSADVDLPGFTPNPFPYMRLASVYVLSSAWEGLPNAMIQALALGTPTVATDCPSGPREILQGGKLGKLVPVGHSEALAQAIDGVLNGQTPPVTVEDLSRFQREEITSTYLQLILGGQEHG